jgi:predicted acetyltransferase
MTCAARRRRVRLCTMPDLVAPTPRVRASFIAAMSEFRAEGRGAPSDNSMVGDEIRDYGPGWADPGLFEEYARHLREQALEDSPRPAGFVPSTTLWWVDSDEYLGRIAIRHRLTPHLLSYGGHIGYDVRPSARRQGHATAMLARALPVAAALGIDRALLTCSEDNIGSRKVIESNGGQFADQQGIKLRFWVPTS